MGELDEAENGMNNGTYKHYIKKENVYSALRLTVGDRVKCDEHKDDENENVFILDACLGTVRCVVLSKNEPNCIFYGIQLDAPNGHSDGRFEEVQFWEAGEKCAAFLKMSGYDKSFLKYSSKKKESSPSKEKKIKKSQ